MRLFQGSESFESFYLKHFDSLQDLQNCTECFKNLSIYSSSIYYQVSQSNTGSFKRILTENDAWLDDNFWKNGGNYMKSPYSLGTLNSNPISFIVSGSEKMIITNDGVGINISPSYSLDINGNVRIYQNSLYVTSIGSVGGIIDYTRYLSVNGSTGVNGQFLKRTFNGNGWNNILVSDVTGLSTYTSSLNTWTGSVNTQLSSLNSYTSSNNVSISNLNQESSSFKTYTSSLNTWTGSVNTQLSSLNSYTSSNNTILNNFSVYTSSMNTWTGSVNTQLSSLNTFSSSINSLTGSYFKQGGNSFGQSGSLGTNDNNNLHIITSGSTRIFVSSSGAIGLGTSTPVSSYLITANGNTLISNGRFGTSTLGINIFNYSGVTPRISSDGNLDYLATNTHRWYRSGDLHMMSLGSTGLRISSTFSTASYALDVQGTIGLSGILYVGNTSYGLPLSSGSDGQFLKRSNYLGSFVLNTWDNITTSDVTGLNSFTSSINNFSSSINSLTGSYFKQGGNSFGQSGSLGTNDNYSLVFKTNGLDRMYINENGNVGIGVSTLSSKLSILGGSLSTTPNSSLNISSLLTNGRTGTFDINTLSSIHTFFDNSSVEISAGSTNLYTTGISVTGISATLYAGTIRLITSSTEKMRIDSNGNVGISTTSPLHNLQVGTASFSSQINPNLQIIAANMTDARIGASTGTGKTTTIRNTGSYGEIFAYDYSGSIAQRLLINQYGGNVSIGTDVDSLDKLNVNGSINITSNNYFKQNGYISMYRTGSYNILSDSSGSNAILLGSNTDPSNYYDNTSHIFRSKSSVEYMRINSTGIGIGISSPSTKIHVYGSGYVTTNHQTTANNAGTMSNYITATRTYSIGSRDDFLSGQFHIVDETAASSRFSISSNGNIGIGTFSPNTYAKLDITSTTSGVLFPRMTTTQKNLITGSAGLVVYDTTLSKLQVYTTTWENLH